MATVLCPHCKTVNPGNSRYCEACGKALPTTIHNSPRVVTGPNIPQSKAAQRLMGGDLEKQMKRAAYTLLALGILVLIIGGILTALVNKAPASANMPPEAYVTAYGLLVLGAIYLALFFWARKSPLPAMIAGLVLYSTLQLVSIGIWAQGLNDPDRPKGSPIGCIQIIIFILLIQGVQAGIKHRQLQKAGMA